MRKIPTACLICLLILLLAGCAGPAAPGVHENAASGQVNTEVGAAEAAETATPPPTPSPSPDPILFAAGEAAWDTEELEMVLQPGESALLDKLTHLRVLDARGSECYEELCTWSREHPEAEVRFTVPVPGIGDLESSTETLDLTGNSPEEVLKAVDRLVYLPRLRELSLPAGEEGMDLDAALDVAAKLPEAVIAYPFTIYGQEADLSDTELVLFHTRVYDQGEEVRRVLPGMHACTWLDMDSCGVDNENMARIRDENPDVEVIWRVWFGENYSVRTNVTKILASMPSQGGMVLNENVEGLYYCTNVRYLDLGHNEMLSDFGFVRNMPDLELAVISMAPTTDLSPFSGCEHLRYLEMGLTAVTDLSPLASCTELRHLNIGTNIGITDISPLYDIPLKRLWIGSYTPVPEEQVEKMQALHPDCVINTTIPSGLELAENGGALNEGFTILWKNYSLPLDWRGSQPIGWYKVVAKCFDYAHGGRAYAFCWNDPKYWGNDPYVKPVNVQVWDTSFLFEDWTDPHQDEPEDPDAPPGELLYELEH